MPTEVFLSHSSKDREFVSQLADLLRKHGVPVWYSETNLPGAQQWHDEIGKALQRCDWFVLVLSPDAVESMWVKRGLMFALQQARFEGHIVPVLYKDCDFVSLSWVLSSVRYVDLRSQTEEAYRQLMRTWGLRHQPDI